jgi:hypothetical protein
LRYDSRARRLFTLGVQREQEASFTVLKARVGEGWEQEKTLHRSPGDDPASSLAMDEEGRIYGLLGREGIAGWNGASLFFLEKAHHRPQKLFVSGSGGRLFCLNRERTLTCLDLQSRRILFNLYLFASGAWAALDEKGSLLASSGAETLLIPLD